jgi:glycerate kinase
MKVVIAIDSFKGSLSSIAAGEAAAAGIRDAIPDAETIVRPLADGGEGTVDALIAGMGGERRTVAVTGPMGRPVEAAYGILPGGTAVMEMAAAAGITLVAGEERNPLVATTFGVGEMIADAIRAGCRRFVVGIGGSATNDGGAGMLQALGFRLLDRAGQEIPRGGEGLARLDRIDRAAVLPELATCAFRVACDVTNPLCGAMGASAVFGPQKGATPEMVATLDAALAHFAEVSGGEPEAAGAGAAGGLGFAFRTFLGGELKRGVEIVLEETHLAEAIQDADLVVTGEGRLDAQTVMGKAPIGVAHLAKRLGKRVIAFSGCVTSDAGAVNEHGIDAFFPILREVTTLETALEKGHAAANLAATAEQVFRCFRLGAH